MHLVCFTTEMPPTQLLWIIEARKTYNQNSYCGVHACRAVSIGLSDWSRGVETESNSSRGQCVLLVTCTLTPLYRSRHLSSDWLRLLPSEKSHCNISWLRNFCPLLLRAPNSEVFTSGNNHNNYFVAHRKHTTSPLRGSINLLDPELFF